MVKNLEIEKLIFPTIQLLEILLIPLGGQYNIVTRGVLKNSIFFECTVKRKM